MNEWLSYSFIEGGPQKKTACLGHRSSRVRPQRTLTTPNHPLGGLCKYTLFAREEEAILCVAVVSTLDVILDFTSQTPKTEFYSIDSIDR